MAVPKGKTARVKRRDRKNVQTGVAHITSTFNNTVVTITDPAGNVLAWSTAGRRGIPWIACTGHGRDALEAAIRRAITVIGRNKPSSPNLTSTR